MKTLDLSSTNLFVSMKRGLKGESSYITGTCVVIDGGETAR
jgi:hypothetical protein